MPSRTFRPTLLVTLIGCVLAASASAQQPSNNRHPAISVDGTKLYFDSDRDGNSEIYVMDADGTNVRRLTFDPAMDMGSKRDAEGGIVFGRGGSHAVPPQTMRITPDGSEISGARSSREYSLGLVVGWQHGPQGIGRGWRASHLHHERRRLGS